MCNSAVVISLHFIISLKIAFLCNGTDFIEHGSVVNNIYKLEVFKRTVKRLVIEGDYQLLNETLNTGRVGISIPHVGILCVPCFSSLSA